MDFSGLSENHPLRTDPHRPWPYAVTLGLRLAGARRIVKHKIVNVRATSPDSAKTVALREARAMPASYIDGKRLIISRPVSVRALDKSDAINVR